MKKIIFSFVLLFVFIVAKSQTETGDWLIGGRIDLNTAKNSTHIGINPNAVVFVIKNFAVGGNFLIDYSKSGDGKSTDFGIGPFLRYYFLNGNARPLLHAAISYLSSKVKGPSYSNTNNGGNY